MSIADRIAMAEAGVALLLGMAAEHRRLADDAERGARELVLTMVELQAEQARAEGRIQ